VAIRAIQLGAEVVEVHFDLADRQGAETEHSWTPMDVEFLLRLWGDGLHGHFARLDGTGIKAPQPRELAERLWRADPSDGLRPLKEARKPL
jgi:N-acetylneuraminate synthase